MTAVDYYKASLVELEDLKDLIDANNNSKNNFRQLKNPLENIQAIRAKELHNKINMEKKAQRRLGTPI